MQAVSSIDNIYMPIAGTNMRRFVLERSGFGKADVVD